MQSDLFLSAPLSLDLPDAEITYYPDFIQGQSHYYQTLINDINWQQDTLGLYGRQVLIPRLNAWYGESDADYSYSGLDLTPLPWTKTLLVLKSAVEQQLRARFNSVLANYYRDGADSVAWHSDDEPELGEQPLIASLSFGATRRFSLRSRFSLCNNNEAKPSPKHLDLAGGSLLVMGGTTQRYWQHQIPKTRRAVAGRINLTFRTIVKK